MDTYNLVTKIPYVLLLLFATGFLFQVFFGGLVSLDVDIEENQEEKFRQTVVLENLLSVKLTQSEMSNIYDDRLSSYEQRRAILPIEFFNEDDSDGVGYETDNGHCYIERVAGLDGDEYGYYIETLYPVSRHASGTDDIGCTDPVNPTNAVSSPALLIRENNENPRLPVRLWVYEIN